MLFPCSLVSLSPRRSARRGLPERTPSHNAKAHTVYQHKSKAGLRYAWCVPKGYDGKKAFNLTLICHGTGLDYRWGFANHRAGVFRPNDIVVSVDGPSPGANNSRLFLGEKKDAAAVRAFLKELRELFRVDRVFMYGHSQGGFFVAYYAGEFPKDVDGVVAHASGAWGWSKTGKSVRRVAIAYQHGTLDPVVPYSQSVGTRDHYAKLGFPRLHLRRLARYNHWPNAVRSNESLAWCEGMTCKDPARALAAVGEILRPKRSDQYQWRTVVGFAAAWDVLRRFDAKGELGFAQAPSAKQLADAKSLRSKIDDAGKKHVAALKKASANKKASALKLDGKAWLGHLVALREDFRGVPSVEAYMASIGYDKTLAKHAKAASKISKSWYKDKDPAKIARTVLKELPKAFLVEGLPASLAKKMNEWKKDAKKLGLKKRELRAFKVFANWEKGWKSGGEAYAKIWKKWK